EPESFSPGDGAGDEPKHLAAFVVDAQRFWRTVESGCPQIGQQSVDGWCPRPGWPADRIANADDAGADVPSRKRLLVGLGPILARVLVTSDPPLYVHAHRRGRQSRHRTVGGKSGCSRATS